MSGRRRNDRDDRDHDRRPARRSPPPRRRDGRSRSRSPPRRDTRRNERDDDRRDHKKRSRSPPGRRDDRDRRRSRSPPPRRDDRDRRPRERSPPRFEPARHPTGPSNDRIESPAPPAQANGKNNRAKAVDLMGNDEPEDNADEAAMEEDGEERDDEAQMMAMMGFSGFDSTKGKEVDGNQDGGVDIKKRRTWRQYMNRRGGFNRPLDRVK